MLTMYHLNKIDMLALTMSMDIGEEGNGACSYFRLSRMNDIIGNSPNLLLWQKSRSKEAQRSYGRDLCHCREKGIPRFDIISLNIHKTTSRWYCMAVVLRPRLLTFACLAWHPANCSTALPKVFSSDLPVCQCIRTHMLV